MKTVYSRGDVRIGIGNMGQVVVRGLGTGLEKDLGVVLIKVTGNS